jgi:hypothetical protein
VHAFVIERVVRGAEEFFIGCALVERGIMLAGHQAQRLYLQLGDDRLELAHALLPHRYVVGGVGEIAGEDDEVRLHAHAVDGGDGLLQRHVLGDGRFALRRRGTDESEEKTSPPMPASFRNS